MVTLARQALLYLEVSEHYEHTNLLGLQTIPLRHAGVFLEDHALKKQKSYSQSGKQADLHNCINTSVSLTE